jgi:hypothetical protein
MRSRARLIHSRRPTMRRLFRAPSPALIISLIALFVALGGTSYAAIAIHLPKNSVGTAQIKNGAVTAKKINATGLVVSHATSASHLGGIDPDGYQRSTLPSGQTEEGVYAVWDRAASSGGYMGDTVTFPVALAADIPAANVTFVGYPATSATHCAGLGYADAGYLCIYETYKGNSDYSNTFNPVTTHGGASRLGFSSYFEFSGSGGAWSYGAWAVTAP